MKYVVTVYQNAKYRAVIEAQDRDDAYDIANELITEGDLPGYFEWVKEDLDIDVSDYR